MSKKLLLTAFVLLGLFGFTNVQAASLDSEEEAFIDLLNEYRRTLGRTELKVSENLTDSAEWFAQDSADHPDDINSDHTDSRGEDPEERGDRWGYYFLTENLGWGQQTGTEIYNSWRNSTAHDVNMSIKEARSMGVSRVYKAGATKGGVTTEWYWVAVFSDEGVARLDGNNLKDDELVGTYIKMDVRVKDGDEKLKWHQVKVEDLNDDYEREVDRDLTDKKGRATLFSESARRVKITVRDVLQGKNVATRTVNWDGYRKETFDLGSSSSSSSSSSHKSRYKFRLVNSSGKSVGRVRAEIWVNGKFIKSRDSNTKSKVKFGKSSLKKKIKKITGSKENRANTQIKFIQGGRVIGNFYANLRKGKSFRFQL